MAELGKKAAAAVELMKAGAYWRQALESQYRGGEKFAMRLRGQGGVIKGFGYKTYFEMEKAGLLVWRECGKSSVWPSEYVLKGEGV